MNEVGVQGTGYTKTVSNLDADIGNPLNQRFLIGDILFG